MENDSAFLPIGTSNAISAAASPPTAIQIGPLTGSQYAMMVYNSGTVLVTLGYGSTAAIAAANAVTPTSGSPTLGVVVAPGLTKTFTVAPGQFWTATAASASTVYLQPGFGI